MGTKDCRHRHGCEESKGVKTEVIVPPVANHTPSLKITWDPNVTKLTSEELGKRLREGSPSIEVVSWEEKDSIKVTVFMLKTGEDRNRREKT